MVNFKKAAVLSVASAAIIAAATPSFAQSIRAQRAQPAGSGPSGFEQQEIPNQERMACTSSLKVYYTLRGIAFTGFGLPAPRTGFASSTFRASSGLLAPPEAATVGSSFLVATTTTAITTARMSPTTDPSIHPDTDFGWATPAAAAAPPGPQPPPSVCAEPRTR